MINPKVNALVQTLSLKGYPQFENGLGRFQAKNGHAETVAGYPMDPPGWRDRQNSLPCMTRQTGERSVFPARGSACAAPWDRSMTGPVERTGPMV